MLLDAESHPDRLVELLPPLLWLYHVAGMPANQCVNGCMVLKHAYTTFGIRAEPTAVDLTITDRSTDAAPVFYGRADPYWDWESSTFHGHCALWLPRSGRLLDATVEQYPEVRRYQLGPVLGRIAATSATREDAEAIASGVLPAGTHIGVERGDLLLLYTTAGEQYRGVVDGELPAGLDEQARRAGRNLASHALTMLRIPEVAQRVRRGPYPRLHAMLDAVGTCEFSTDFRGDYWFHTETGQVRIEDLDVPQTPAEPPAPAPSVLPEGMQDPRAQSIMQETSVAAQLLAPPAASEPPTVLLEPLHALMAGTQQRPVMEVQAEAAIAAGMRRLVSVTADDPPLLSHWRLQRTPRGVELWEGDGSWAVADLTIGDDWLQSAGAAGAVRVLYGVRLGVRVLDGQQPYTPEQRLAEIEDSCRQGIVAAAIVPWQDAGG